MNFLVTTEDGSLTIRGHPGWRIGETPDTSRLLTDDELVDAGYGKKIVDTPPAFDPNTQYLAVKPLDQWPTDERTATKLYEVVTIPPLTQEEIAAQQQAEREAALSDFDRQRSINRALGAVIFKIVKGTIPVNQTGLTAAQFRQMVISEIN